MKTTRQVADLIGCTTSRIRQVAKKNELGTLLDYTTKVFSSSEVRTIQRLMKPKGVGRPRISKNLSESD